MKTALPRPELLGFSLGLYATLGQVVLMREALTVCGGNELALGIGLAAWLLGVGAGAVLAGFSRGGYSFSVLGASLLTAPALVGGLLLLRLHRVVLELPLGGDPSLGALFAVLGAALVPGGATVGWLFTAASRSDLSPPGARVTRIYAAEAGGALVGGLLFRFALAGCAAPLQSIGLACAVLLSGVALAAPWRLSGALAGLAAAGLAVFGLLSAGPDARTTRLAFERIAAGARPVAIRESAYGRLILAEDAGEHRLYADGRLVRSFPDPWGRTPEVHLALSQHPDPGSVLLVGGGGPDRLQAALAHEPSRVDLTFLDREELELCRGRWPRGARRALADPRVEIVLDDGRHHLATTQRRYDVVVVAARPPESSGANRYHTREFFAAVRRALKPGGSMTARAPGGANVLAPEAARAAASVLAAVEEVFSQVVVVPGLRTHLCAANQPEVVSSDAELLRRRFERRVSEARGFSSSSFAALLEPARKRGLRRQLERRETKPNSDLHPVAYLENIQLWERGVSGERGAARPTWTGRAQRSAWLPALAPLLAWIGWRLYRVARRRPRRGRLVADGLISIATTGAVGMAVEIVLLDAFQAASGRVYTGLALIVALFMAGLAIGAAAGRRWLATRGAAAPLAADAIVLGLAALSWPLVASALDAPGWIAGWSAVAGAATGASFPALLGAVARARTGEEPVAASAVEAADHLGAAFGALVTGALWIPVYGIPATCLMLAGIKAISMLGHLPLARR